MSSSDLTQLAIIGMAGRFPGAADLETFWHNLRDGVESISFFTDEELTASGVSMAARNQPNYVRARGVLEHIDLFDAAFFGFSPREAEITDPQQRLFLQVAWEVLEHAGYDPFSYEGAIGVFGGAAKNSYLPNNLYRNKEKRKTRIARQWLSRNDREFLSTLVSYKLNLHGPSMTVQTACSTSLVAVHMACQSLLVGECDIALAGASSITVPQKVGYRHYKGLVYSPDGHCRAFDANSAGTVMSQAVALIAIRRLADAEADGDSICAIIKATAINNDGNRKVSYSAPSVEGQTAVLTEAFELAGIQPGDVTYVECHGTGTELGDPIETTSLTNVLGGLLGQEVGTCAIGSVKTNIGHTEVTAGVAGLIKTVLAMQHKQLPPSLHFETPNPHLKFDEKPLYVNAALREWSMPDGRPLRAGVNAFGVGGTNAHVILEEAPAYEPTPSSKQRHVLLWSGRKERDALRQQQQLATFFEREHPWALADMCYTLQVGRHGFSERRAVVCGKDSALPQLLAGSVLSGKAGETAPTVAFLFPGQGRLEADLAMPLYAAEPVFRAEVDAAAQHLIPLLDFDPLAFFDASRDPVNGLTQTERTQPLLFLFEYALARWLSHLGIDPAIMMGHSLGEFVAATLADVFELPAAAKLVATRGRLMAEAPRGAMLAVGMDEQQLRSEMPECLDLAAVNGPMRCVVSGPVDEIESFAERLAGLGFTARRLETSHGFHSRAMDGILSRFRQAVLEAAPKPPSRPVISNLSGELLSDAEAVDPDYWVRHLRQTVRFDEGLTRLFREEQLLVLELGPNNLLAGLVQRHPARPAETTVLRGVPAEAQREHALDHYIATLARLWCAGVAVDWRAYYAGERRQRVPMPGYVFDLQSYWVDPDPVVPTSEEPKQDTPTPTIEPQAAKRILAKDPADWFYQPGWKPAPALEPATAGPERILMLADPAGPAAPILDRLRVHGHQVTVVAAAGHQVGADFQLPDLDEGALERVFTQLDGLPDRIIHAWSLTTVGDVSQSLSQGFHSLIDLARLLGKQNLSRALPLVILAGAACPVNDGEHLQPLNATLLGAAVSITAEYSRIPSRLVEVLAEEIEAHVDTTVAACLAASPTRLALRHGQVWIPEMKPVEATDTEPKQLVRGGTYLITGGTSGIGQELARYLARDYEATTILLSRRGAPQFQPLRLDNEASWLASQEAQLSEKLGIARVPRDPEQEAELDALCASYALNYLKGAGLDPGQSYRREDLRAKLRILPAYHKFLDFFLDMLEQDGYLECAEDGIRLIDRKMPEPESLSEGLLQRNPKLAGVLEALADVAAHYPQSLSGEETALEMLFSESRTQRLNAAIDQSLEVLRHKLYTELAAQLAGHLATTQHSLRILEIGGGEGFLTGYLLPLLDGTQARLTFTDISPYFLNKARERFANFKVPIDFQRLDITRDIAQQGFAAGSYDLVLGMNVVHATPNLRQSLANLRLLLRPGGRLGLVEETHTARWVTMYYGLAEGWWLFDDGIRSKAPLLPLTRWQEVLTEAGFSPTSFLPQHPTNCGLLLAENPYAATEAVRGSTTYSVDVADEAAMANLAREIEAQHGGLDGIFHAAGLPASGLIHGSNRERMEMVLAPKLAGSLNLARFFGERAGFTFYCGSRDAEIGGMGKADYAAANAFQDALAHDLRAKGQRVFALDWGEAWLQSGMAAQASSFAPYRRAGVFGIWSTYLAQSPDRHVFSAEWAADDLWWLYEHRLQGKPTMPASATFEVVRSALAELGHSGKLVFEDVVFAAPLVIETCARVILLLEGPHPAYQFTLKTADTTIARGRVKEQNLVAATLDLARLEATIATSVREMGSKEASSCGRLAFGPHWQNARELRLAEGQGFLTQVRFESGLPLDPALLDTATGFLISERGGNYLPFMYREVQVHRPLTGRIHTHARLVQEDVDLAELDITLADCEGNVLVEVRGYSLRKQIESTKTPQHAVLQSSGPGRGSNLYFRATPQQKLDPDQVLIETEAVALNFKDSLVSMGIIPPANQSAPFGLELVGRIRSFGEGVNDYKLGERVIAMGHGLLASHVRVPVQQVFHAPEGFSALELATLPVAYLTAYQALYEIGRVDGRDHVLIHNGAGGVGQAAIQVARLLGATIYATAGSEAKRDWLREQGIEYVSDSRSRAFVDDIRKWTDGRGVDVVLDALSGDLMVAGLEVLAPYGRFLEIGKRDILENNSLPLNHFRKNLSYIAIDAGTDMPHFRDVFGRVLKLLKRKKLAPLPHQVFPANKIGDAFDTMARAKHKGKLVIGMRNSQALAQTHAPAHLAGRANTPERPGLTNEQGFDTVKRALCLGLPRVIVSKHDPRIPESQPRGNQRPTASTTDTLTQRCSALYARYLGKTTVAPDEDFFELGGDSLIAIQITADLNDSYQLGITPGDLMGAPTVAGLVALLGERGLTEKPHDTAPVADLVRKLWRDFLGVDDPEADFFESGGDSLTAIQMITTLNRELGLKLAPGDLLTIPRMRDFIATLPQATTTPENKLHEMIFELWRDFLGVHDDSADFFECGGDSLTAIQIVAVLNRDLGLHLSPGSLLDNPLLPEFVALVAQLVEPSEKPKSGSRNLVTIQDGEDEHPPLFLFHAGEGRCHHYRHLAKHLPGLKIYGFEAPGIDGEEAPLETVEAMAQRYLPTIRDLQPHGPYRLGGSSLGGAIAYEIACQLSEAGEDVEMVAMFDTPLIDEVPETYQSEAKILAYMATQGKNYEAELARLEALPREEQLRGFLAGSGSKIGLTNDADTAHLARFIRVLQTHVAALASFQPRPYEGVVLFLSASERDPFNPAGSHKRWQSLVPNLNIIEVPGTHITMNFPPNIETLANELNRELQVTPS